MYRNNCMIELLDDDSVPSQIGTMTRTTHLLCGFIAFIKEDRIFTVVELHLPCDSMPAERYTWIAGTVLKGAKTIGLVPSSQAFDNASYIESVNSLQWV